MIEIGPELHKYLDANTGTVLRARVGSTPMTDQRLSDEQVEDLVIWSTGGIGNPTVSSEHFERLRAALAELQQRRAAEAQIAPAETAEEMFTEQFGGTSRPADRQLAHDAFLAGYAARGPALTPAELRTLYDLAFGHDPRDRWDEPTEALRAKLQAASRKEAL